VANRLARGVRQPARRVWRNGVASEFNEAAFKERTARKIFIAKFVAMIVGRWICLEIHAVPLV
jgi:hypothetical protein